MNALGGVHGRFEIDHGRGSRRCLLGRVSLGGIWGVKMDERGPHMPSLSFKHARENFVALPGDQSIDLDGESSVGEISCSKVKREGFRQVAPAPAFFDCRDPRGRFLGLVPDERRSMNGRGMYFYDAKPRRRCRQQEDAEPHSQAWERGGGEVDTPSLFHFPRDLPPSSLIIHINTAQTRI
jgi:hypothetical protein